MSRVSRILVLAGAVVSLCAGGSEGDGRVSPGSFDLCKHGRRFDLIAENASGREILHALGDAVGAEVECPAGWDAPVTVRMQGADLESVMRAVAENWALFDEDGGGGEEQRRRIVVIDALDGSAADAALLYREALDSFESPTRDEQRLIRLILQRGWTDDGRALDRLFEANAEAMAAFEVALRGRAACFDWSSRALTLEAVQGGRGLVDVYLVARVAELANGDSRAFAEMAQAIKFAADAGRAGPIEARMVEGSLRREVLEALSHSASRARGSPASLRSALRTLEFHAPEAEGMAAALASAWPEGRIVGSLPEGDLEIAAADLASMSPGRFAPIFAAAMRGELEALGVEPSDLATLRRVLEHRAQTDRQETLTRLRLAALAYETERGAMPAAVEDLVPGYLASVPTDPLTGDQLDGATFSADGQPRLPARIVRPERDVARPRAVWIPPEESERLPPLPDEVMPPASDEEDQSSVLSDE